MARAWRIKDTLGSLFAIVYALPSLAYPLGNDQALHWYLGRRWLEGELPFVSGISSKPIGIFVVHALSIGVFGPHEWPLRVAELLTVLGSGWVAALLAVPSDRPVHDGELGLGALAFSGAYYTFFDYWDVGHPELWEGAFVLAALAVAWRGRTPWLRESGAGALSMIAFMFKYPAALPALVVYGACVLRAVRERQMTESVLPAALRASLRFGLGALPIVALCVLPFALAGKLDVMWEILYVYIFVYAERAVSFYGSRLPAWLRIEHGGGLLLLSAMSALVTLVLAWERRRAAVLERTLVLVGTLALAAASVVVQGRYFDYHWMVLVPFCAAVIVLALVHVPRTDSAPSFVQLAGLTVALLLVAAAGPRWIAARHTYLEHTTSLVAYLRGRESREQFLAPFRGRGKLDARVLVERVAADIRKRARPGDTMCARGFSTVLHPATDLPCPSRHVVEMIVAGGLPDWRREYVQTLERHPATFMVTFHDRRADTHYLERRGYHLVASEGLFAVYSLRPDELTTSSAAAH